MTSGFYPRTMEDSVVTVGHRATLPSIFVENEFERSSSGQPNLRFRNQKANLVYDDSTYASVRSTPSYGTPGTTRNFSDYDSPDSGFHGGRNCSYDPVAKAKEAIRENLDGSYVSPELSDMDRRGSSPLRTSPFEQAKIKSSLRELQSRWRHQQRRAALHGVKDSFKDIWDCICDLDTTKEIMPIVVTSIIIASCVVTLLLLTSGLRHNLEASKVPDGANGKYKSIEYGSMKLKERLENENRILKDNLRDENGELLGGKKASIQFAHNVRNKLVQGGNVAQNTIEFEDPVFDEVIENPTPVTPEVQVQGDEALEELSAKVAVKVANMISRTGDPDTDRLLQKLNSFGHSTTPKVDVDIDSKVEVKSEDSVKDAPETGNVKSSTEELKKVKKSKPITPNEAPFKIHKELPVTSKPQKKLEDDPFRGKLDSAKDAKSSVVKRDSGSPSAENPSKANVVADKKGVEPTKKVKCIHKQPTEGEAEGPKKS